MIIKIRMHDLLFIKTISIEINFEKSRKKYCQNWTKLMFGIKLKIRTKSINLENFREIEKKSLRYFFPPIFFRYFVSRYNACNNCIFCTVKILYTYIANINFSFLTLPLFILTILTSWIRMRSKKFCSRRQHFPTSNTKISMFSSMFFFKIFKI